jgi:hypothetical protein
MIVWVRSERHPSRLLANLAWVLFSVLMALIAGAGLVGSIANSGYDPHEDRAPEARIAVAALATAVGLAAVTVAVRRLRGAEGRRGLLTGLCLTAATVMLIALLALVDIASGPL